MDPDIHRTISFWFDRPHTHWFRPPEKFDDEIRANFGPLITRAHTHELDAWADEPQGSLALLLLLDQFPRNVFRGSPDSYSSDAKACSVAVRSIARGFDHQQATRIQQLFFYMPLMHDEQLVSQIACVALFEQLAAACESGSDEHMFVSSSIKFAKDHRDIILKFGRFPSRNKLLGRCNTPEEIEFLKDHPLGF